MRMFDLSVLSSLLVVAACGGDDGGGVVIVDGAPGGDSTPANCLLEANLGSPSLSMAAAQYDTLGMNATAPDYFSLAGTLNADASPDILVVDLYAGYGAFSGGLPTAATTVTLGGAEAGLDSCGACIYSLTDYTQNGPSADPFYVATAGTLNLTSVSTTSVAGSLSNVTLTHSTVDTSSGATTAAADGCASNLASVSFSAVPTMAMARTLPDGTVEQGMRYKLSFDKRSN